MDKKLTIQIGDIDPVNLEELLDRDDDRLLSEYPLENLIGKGEATSTLIEWEESLAYLLSAWHSDAEFFSHFGLGNPCIPDKEHRDLLETIAQLYELIVKETSIFMDSP